MFLKMCYNTELVVFIMFAVSMIYMTKSSVAALYFGV